MNSNRRRRLRSHKLLAAAIAILVLAGIAGGADLGYHFLKTRADQLQAQLTTDLESGQKQLEAGKASLQAANTKHDATLAATASNQFVQAATDFRAAGHLADTSSLLQWLERTPGIKDQVVAKHCALDGIATMGVAISGAGQNLAGLDGELIKPPSTGEAGRTLLTVLGQAQTAMATVKQQFAAAKTAAAGVDVAVLPAPQQATFVKAKATIDTALSGIDEFERLVPVMTEVLGGNGTRTYLIEQVNPAELRPGGGFIGTYSLVRASAGTLSVVQSGDSYNLADPRPLPWQRGFIPQPSPYREIIPNVSWSFVDSNIYPDFPTNATTAESFVQPRIGKVDAVISLDYYTVAEMLALTGPIAVAGVGTLTAANFVPTLIKLDVAGSLNHKTALEAVAGPLMQRVASLPSDRWPALLSALNTMASQRHLQAYFNNPEVEAEIARVGWPGTVNPASAGDFMMEVEANYWGNKTNYFLTRTYSVALTKNGNTLHHVVNVSLTNATFCGSEDRTSYRTNFRLFVASSASAVSDNLRPVIYPNPAPPAGTRAGDGWLPDVYCGGGHGQAVFIYDTAWAPNARGVDQIYWQKQPGTGPDSVDVSWNSDNAVTYHAHGDLSQDLVIDLTVAGIALTYVHLGRAELPSLTLG